MPYNEIAPWSNQMPLGGPLRITPEVMRAGTPRRMPPNEYDEDEMLRWLQQVPVMKNPPPRVMDVTDSFRRRGVSPAAPMPQGRSVEGVEPAIPPSLKALREVITQDVIKNMPGKSSLEQKLEYLDENNLQPISVARNMTGGFAYPTFLAADLAENKIPFISRGGGALLETPYKLSPEYLRDKRENANKQLMTSALLGAMQVAPEYERAAIEKSRVGLEDDPNKFRQAALLSAISSGITDPVSLDSINAAVDDVMQKSIPQNELQVPRKIHPNVAIRRLLPGNLHKDIFDMKTMSPKEGVPVSSMLESLYDIDGGMTLKRNWPLIEKYIKENYPKDTLGNAYFGSLFDEYGTPISERFGAIFSPDSTNQKTSALIRELHRIQKPYSPPPSILLNRPLGTGISE